MKEISKHQLIFNKTPFLTADRCSTVDNFDNSLMTVDRSDDGTSSNSSSKFYSTTQFSTNGSDISEIFVTPGYRNKSNESIAKGDLDEEMVDLNVHRNTSEVEGQESFAGTNGDRKASEDIFSSPENTSSCNLMPALSNEQSGFNIMSPEQTESSVDSHSSNQVKNSLTGTNEVSITARSCPKSRVFQVINQDALVDTPLRPPDFMIVDSDSGARPLKRQIEFVEHDSENSPPKAKKCKCFNLIGSNSVKA